jgi:hypothetical protein
VHEIGAGLNTHGQPNLRPNNDQAYIYLGGWGRHGGAADAGLIHSPAFDHWAVFMSCEGIGMIVDPTMVTLRPDQTVFMEFFIPSDNIIQLNVTGFDLNNDRRLVTMSMNPAKNQGWVANGAGVIMKRMTTIGQQAKKKGDPAEDFHSGSYNRNIHWRDCHIGLNHASADLWSAIKIGGYESYPKTGQVSVEFISAFEETDSIELA